MDRVREASLGGVRAAASTHNAVKLQRSREAGLKALLRTRSGYASLDQPALVLIALTLTTVAARMPFLSNVGVDESFYLVVGRQWLEGHPPYANAFDVKPPLLFALMAVCEAVAGPGLLAVKALAMGAVSATSFGLYLFGRRFLGALTGFGAALFYIAATLTLAGTFSPAELLMGPFVTFGVFLAVRAAAEPRRTRAWLILASGLCLGAGACIKQTAVFEAIPVIGFLLLGGGWREKRRAALSFCAGYVCVPLAFAFLFFAYGQLDALAADVLVSGAARAGAAYVPWSEAPIRLLIELILILPLPIMAGAALSLARLTGGRARRAVLRLLGAWVSAALLAVLATRAMCEFYMLAAVPPLCLLSGYFLDEGLGRLRGSKLRTAARCVACLCVTLFFGSSVARLALQTGDNEPAVYAAASAMRAAGLGADDRIFVPERDLLLYLAAKAEPPASVFHPLQVMCDFAFSDAATAMTRSLERRPAFIVAADPPLHLDCEKPERRALFEATLVLSYCPIGRFGAVLAGGQPGSLVLFARKDRAGSRCFR